MKAYTEYFNLKLSDEYKQNPAGLYGNFSLALLDNFINQMCLYKPFIFRIKRLYVITVLVKQYPYMVK